MRDLHFRSILPECAEEKVDSTQSPTFTILSILWQGRDGHLFIMLRLGRVCINLVSPLKHLTLLMVGISQLIAPTRTGVCVIFTSVTFGFLQPVSNEDRAIFPF